MTLTFLNNAALSAIRESIVTRFNNTDPKDYREKAEIQAEADSFNTYLYAEDADVASICFVCHCGAYANDRQNGIASCDNGCGTINYEMIVL